MPIVPRYTRQVSTSALPAPSVRSPGPNGLEDLGRGVAAIGGATERVAAEVQEVRARADATSLNEFETELYRIRTEEFDHHETGLRQKRGKAAFEASDVTRQNLRARAEEAIGRLPPGVHDRARAKLEEQLAGWDREIELHVGDQLRVAESDSVNGRVGESLDTLVRKFADPSFRHQEIEEVKAKIRAAARTPDEGNLKASEYEKQARIAVLKAHLAAGDTAGARSYFIASEPFLGDDGLTLKKTIEDRHRELEAGRLVGGILAEHADPNRDRMDPVKAEAALADVPEEFREEAKLKLERGLAGATKAWDWKKDQTFHRAHAVLLETDNLEGVDPDDKAWLLKHDTKSWEYLQSRERQRLAEKRAGRGRGGGGRDSASDLALVRLYVDMERYPDKYREMPMETFEREWAPQLGGLYRDGGKEFARRQKEIREGKDSGSSGDFAIAVAGAKEEFGIEGKKDLELFEGALAKWRVRFRSDNNERHPTTKETAEEAARLARAVKLKPSGWRALIGMPEEKPRYRVKKDEVVLEDEPAPTAASRSGAPMRVPGIDLSGAQPTTAPAAKAVAKWQRSPDGRRRRPIYEDGSVGPEEVAP